MQVLEKIEKSLAPVRITLENVTDPPEVVVVIVSEAVVDVVTLPKGSGDGLKDREGRATPVPVTETVCGLPEALSV